MGRLAVSLVFAGACSGTTEMDTEGDAEDTSQPAEAVVETRWMGFRQPLTT